MIFAECFDPCNLTPVLQQVGTDWLIFGPFYLITFLFAVGIGLALTRR